MELNSSVAAVVTGGASGLGEATSRALAKHGVKVAIFDLQKDKGEAVAKEIGGVFCEVNVTNDESVANAFKLARATNGQERILVNCAGTGNAAKTASRDKKTGEIRFFQAVVNAARSSTPRRLPHRMDRSARPPTRRRKPASTA
jgi:NAD(P)-dependent dehydrogenase (short-subunit alcohol dehydrogenase family)